MLRIVDATKVDANTVAGIIRLSFRRQAEILDIQEAKYPNYVAFETEDSVRKRIARGDKVVLGRCAVESIATVSYSLSENGEKGEVKRLAVVPNHRARGYGAILMRYAEDKLVDLGAIELEVSIVASFDRLRKYYESLEYQPTGVKTFPSLPFKVLFLRKTVGVNLEKRHATSRWGPPTA